ncbi:MAG: threonine synthase [Candidatus Latescibacterota bacterium]|jgi:threonine synthase
MDDHPGEKSMNYLTHLECGKCGERLDPDRLWNLCPKCTKPLLARYDLATASGVIARDAAGSRADNLWRYHEFMPVKDQTYRVTLGEGMTPLTHATRLGELLGFDRLYIKDESCNPTTSFKARGMAAAVSRAWELGATSLSVPSAGNAAGAMAAYAAAAGLPAHVYMPKDVPEPFVAECRALGAEVKLIDGLITDCGRAAVEAAKKHNRFDLSTLKEPYRLEGKKTMGYELAEQYGWKLPDVVIYPTGGGTGLVGMWKAFDEMEQLGWIGSERPRMVTVQSTGCAPIVRAFDAGAEAADPWEGARTVADGLRVPAAVGDFLMLAALRGSGGTAVAVTDEEMVEDARLIGRTEGIFAAPEGGATVSAFRRLRERGWIADGERTVLFITGSGHKYAHLFT